jgi:hypothetical protein
MGVIKRHILHSTQAAFTFSGLSRTFLRNETIGVFLVIRHGSAGGLGRFAGFGANR